MSGKGIRGKGGKLSIVLAAEVADPDKLRSCTGKDAPGGDIGKPLYRKFELVAFVGEKTNSFSWLNLVKSDNKSIQLGIHGRYVFSSLLSMKCRSHRREVTVRYILGPNATRKRISTKRSSPEYHP